MKRPAALLAAAALSITLLGCGGDLATDQPSETPEISTGFGTEPSSTVAPIEEGN